MDISIKILCVYSCDLGIVTFFCCYDFLVICCRLSIVYDLGCKVCEIGI